jgi:hypothetical protein
MQTDLWHLRRLPFFDRARSTACGRALYLRAQLLPEIDRNHGGLL